MFFMGGFSLLSGFFGGCLFSQLVLVILFVWLFQLLFYRFRCFKCLFFFLGFCLQFCFVFLYFVFVQEGCLCSTFSTTISISFRLFDL